MANGLFGGGSGTTSAPYLVEDAADLEAVRKVLSAHYKQVANIDMLAVANFAPIGSQSTPFTGSYEGGDFQIQNLTMSVSSTTGYTGLFAHIVSPATVRNLHVTNGNFSTSGTGNGNFNGTIVGYYASSQNLENLSFQGTAKFTGSGNSGGIVGATAGTNGAKTVKCKFTGTLEFAAGNYQGGIQGSVGGNDAYDCHFSGSISSLGNYVGGIRGHGNVFDSTVDATIIATGPVGGIVCSSSATRCVVRGAKIQSTNSDAYGVCSSTATDCINHAVEVIGKGHAMGISSKAVRCVNYSTVRGVTGAFGISLQQATDCANRGPLVTSEGISSGVSGWSGRYDYQTARCLCTANVETTGTEAAGITTGNYGADSVSYGVINCYFLGGHVKGLGATTAKIGRITSVPRVGNTGNYALDTARVVLE